MLASTEQIGSIEIIEEHMGLNRLPAPLYEAALLRLNHPEATLQELAELAEIGKSGMNHRLARLVRIAKEIRHVISRICMFTQYSLLDGAARIPDLVARAKSMGQTALAITDPV